MSDGLSPSLTLPARRVVSTRYIAPPLPLWRRSAIVKDAPCTPPTPRQGGAVIHVSKLTKFYGDYPAIRDVSFDVPKGKVVGFLGPNGAGKTTTLRILAGFLTATSGTATIDGLDVFWQPLEVRRRIGYMPENCPLYPEMRVTEYLRFRAGVKGLHGRAARKRVE